MRLLALIILTLCILVFIGGGALLYYGSITKDAFIGYSGVAGGVASVLGLISLIKRPITTEDFQNIELESLKKAMVASEELNELHKKKEKYICNISSLQSQKAELEYLVRKASLAIFLKEKRNWHEKRILDYINKESDLSTSLNEIKEIDIKLIELEEDIEKNQNVDELRSIIKIAEKKLLTFDDFINSMPSSFMRNAFMFIYKAYKLSF